MERILRNLVTLAILIGSLAWIVFSYIPDRLIEIPKYRFDVDNIGPVSIALIIVSLLAILFLQIWITLSTGRSIREYNQSEKAEKQGFHLRPGVEMALTATPIVFTLLLGGAAYVWWSGLLRLP